VQLEPTTTSAIIQGETARKEHAYDENYDGHGNEQDLGSVQVTVLQDDGSNELPQAWDIERGVT
jgi:hypothetical protein